MQCSVEMSLLVFKDSTGKIRSYLAVIVQCSALTHIAMLFRQTTREELT